MTRRRPRREQRPLNFHPLNHEARPFVFIGANFFHRRRQRGQALGEDADAVLRFELFGELDDRRLVGGHGVVINEPLLGHFFERAGRHTKVDRLALALKTVARNAEAIFAAHVAAKVPHGDADVGGFPRSEDRHAIVHVTVNTARGLHGFLLADVELLVDLVRPRLVGDGLIQRAVGRVEVTAHQIRGRVQRFGAVVETAHRGIQRQQIGQIHFHSEQIAHGVRILRAVEPAQNHAALRGPPRDFCRTRTCADPFDGSLDLFRGRTRLVLRRHVARVEMLQHGQPLLAVFPVSKVRRQTLDQEVALGLGPRVAFLTVLGEQQPGGIIRWFAAGCCPRFHC